MFKFNKSLKSLFFFIAPFLVSILFIKYNNPVTTKNMRNNVVYVLNESNSGGGTGFATFSKYYNKVVIVTNSHVCEGVKFVPDYVKVPLDFYTVIQQEKDHGVNARILDISDKYDLCMIEAPKHLNLVPLKLASSIDKDEEIKIFGHPLLLELTESRGFILDRQEFPMPNFLSPAQCNKPKHKLLPNIFLGTMMCHDLNLSDVTNILAQPGNSGSPAVNSKGQLVGVLWGGFNRLQWGLLVPLEHLKDYLNNK